LKFWMRVEQAFIWSILSESAEAAAFAAWPAALPRPAPPARLAQRPTLNQHSTWTTQLGLISKRPQPPHSTRNPAPWIEWMAHWDGVRGSSACNPRPDSAWLLMKSR